MLASVILIISYFLIVSIKFYKMSSKKITPWQKSRSCFFISSHQIIQRYAEQHCQFYNETDAWFWSVTFPAGYRWHWHIQNFGKLFLCNTVLSSQIPDSCPNSFCLHVHHLIFSDAQHFFPLNYNYIMVIVLFRNNYYVLNPIFDSNSATVILALFATSTIVRSILSTFLPTVTSFSSNKYSIHFVLMFFFQYSCANFIDFS